MYYTAKVHSVMLSRDQRHGTTLDCEKIWSFRNQTNVILLFMDYKPRTSERSYQQL